MLGCISLCCILFAAILFVAIVGVADRAWIICRCRYLVCTVLCAVLGLPGICLVFRHLTTMMSWVFMILFGFYSFCCLCYSFVLSLCACRIPPSAMLANILDPHIYFHLLHGCTDVVICCAGYPVSIWSAYFLLWPMMRVVRSASHSSTVVSGSITSEWHRWFDQCWQWVVLILLY